MRVVWALNKVPGHMKFSPLQYFMLFASAYSIRKFSSVDVTTVLYASKSRYEEIKALGFLDLWDEHREVLDSTNTILWDYIKVDALFREQAKVLYIDYDIVFFEDILAYLDPQKQYVYDRESLDLEGIYLSQKQMTKLGSKLVYGSEALNSGILYLDYETVLEWKGVYDRDAKVVSKLSKKFKSFNEQTNCYSLSLGQGGLGKVLDSQPYLTVNKNVPPNRFEHFMGHSKIHPNDPKYPFIFEGLKGVFPELAKRFVYSNIYKAALV